MGRGGGNSGFLLGVSGKVPDQVILEPSDLGTAAQMPWQVALPQSDILACIQEDCQGVSVTYSHTTKLSLRLLMAFSELWHSGGHRAGGANRSPNGPEGPSG